MRQIHYVQGINNIEPTISQVCNIIPFINLPLSYFSSEFAIPKSFQIQSYNPSKKLKYGELFLIHKSYTPPNNSIFLYNKRTKKY